MKSKLCTIVISLLIALSFSACSARKNWHFISATSFLSGFSGRELSVNPNNGNIAAASDYPAVLYLMQDLENLERIPLPAEDNKIEIRDICYADEIWVVTRHDQRVLSYDPGTQSWTLHPELGEMYACYVMPDSRLILWHTDELHIYDSQWVTITLSSPPPSPIITQDAEGSLWVLASPAELYKLDQNGLSFVKSFEIFNAVQLFVPSTGDVWIVTQDHIYVWRPTDADKPLESILDFTDLPHKFWIYEDSTGTIWIVNRHHIWTYTGTQFEEIDLPVRQALLQYAPLYPRSIRLRLTVRSIWGATFDHQKDRLYVTTSDGIYYLDLVGPSAQGSE